MKSKAATTKKTFSRSTIVSIDIKADAATIWALLTNASDFPRWNSTVTSLDGKIALGEKLALKVTLDEKRTFKLKVKEFKPDKHMRWGDAMGNREYTLTPFDGGVTFTRNEKIGGPFFPLFATMTPPLDQEFDQYAADLKKEAESKVSA
ncbi:MAG: hypothetical protein ACI85F_001557 [Bacteroidia bacterium]|jgi:uncharacterized protein YndB with AHSA1/START domain